MVRLSLLDEGGARVQPTLYDDNYLWLLPGESRTVTLSWPASALPSGRPKLRVEGYKTPRPPCAAEPQPGRDVQGRQTLRS